jgi:hypothetical protein
VTPHPNWARVSAPIAAGLAMIVAAPTAHASSIVHIRGAHVWLVDPDNGREHQVTTTGDGYEHPSQDDNGIIAVSGQRLRQSGERIDSASEGEISPDGTTIAASGIRLGCTQYCGGTTPGVIHGYTDFLPTQSGARPVEHEFEWRIAGWADSRRALMMTNGTLGLFGPDGVDDNGPTWFIPENTVHDGDWTPGGGGLLALAGESGGETILELLRAPGPPEIPESRCYFRDSAGTIEDPTWSPDGTRLAWEGSAGIKIAAIPNLDDCSALEAELLVPGGKDPHWSAATINPPARTTDPRLRTTTLDARFRPGRHTTTIRQLRLRYVPAGTRVTLRCSARRCLRGPATMRVTRATQSLDLRSRLRKRTLPTGTVLTIGVAGPGQPRRTWQLRVRRGRAPQLTTHGQRLSRLGANSALPE